MISFIGSGLATSAMEKARKFVPGLFGSGQTGNIMIPAAGASAARDLFEAQPNALVRDLFVEAFKDPKLLLELLEAAPTDKRKFEKLQALPAFLGDAGIRLLESLTQEEPLEDVGVAPVDPTLPGERRRQARPTPGPRPAPAPQPAFDPAAYMADIQARYDEQLQAIQQEIRAADEARSAQLAELTKQTEERKKKIKKPRNYARLSLLSGSELGIPDTTTLGG